MAKCERCGGSGLTMGVLCGCCGEPPVEGAAPCSADLGVASDLASPIGNCGSLPKNKAGTEAAPTFAVVFRHGKPIACFALKALADEFVKSEPYRKHDTIAMRRVTFKGDSGYPSPQVRTIADAIADYKTTPQSAKDMIHKLVSTIVGLHCAHCGKPVPVTIEA